MEDRAKLGAESSTDIKERKRMASNFKSNRVTIKDRLIILYPTKEDILKARKNYNSWDQMALAIGITKDSLQSHRRLLGVTKESVGKKPKNFTDITCGEVDENIRQLMQGESKNVVTRYKITDMETFLSNPCGNEGLELIGTEQGTSWRQVSHRMPNAI